ncbi:MAG: histidine phosphatase family protein [Luminiphilus sp.]|jgi:broad specificity phosphatase PhoE|nr:histidine phosphatase family protein [Luminiphilus sp.]
MAEIWLVRHGEAVSAFDQDTDPPLSALGRKQAERTAQYLKDNVPPEATLLTSPKRRAIETGQPLANFRSVDLLVDPRFIELPSPGSLESRGAWIKQVLAARWGELPPAVQLWREELRTALASFEMPTVVFTHFLVINSVAARMSGDDTVMQCLPANASVHHLRIEKDDWQWSARGDMLESPVN